MMVHTLPVFQYSFYTRQNAESRKVAVKWLFNGIFLSHNIDYVGMIDVEGLSRGAQKWTLKI